jgi:plasmid stabilization system protein ParE
MIVEWSKNALEDLDRIHDHIAKDSAHYAKAVVERLLKRCGQLETFPGSGHAVPEYNRNDVSELLVHSYRIIHQVTKNKILILTVIHGAHALPLTPPPRSDTK